MKNFGFIQLGHSDIYPGETEEPVLVHEKEGVKIEVETDSGNWWITGVSVNGNEYNVYDSFEASNMENNSGEDRIEQLLEEGTHFEDACKEVGADWYVRINDAAYAFVNK
jgi:hypothetical protein